MCLDQGQPFLKLRGNQTLLPEDDTPSEARNSALTCLPTPETHPSLPPCHSVRGLHLRTEGWVRCSLCCQVPPGREVPLRANLVNFTILPRARPQHKGHLFISSLIFKKCSECLWPGHILGARARAVNKGVSPLPSCSSHPGASLFHLQVRGKPGLPPKSSAWSVLSLTTA